MASVRSSSTFTKPAGSPFGEISAVPSSSVEAMKTKGAAAMKRRLARSITLTTLASERWCGSPATARTSASLVITSRKRALSSVAWFTIISLRESPSREVARSGMTARCAPPLSLESAMFARSGASFTAMARCGRLGSLTWTAAVGAKLTQAVWWSVVMRTLGSGFVGTQPTRTRTFASRAASRKPSTSRILRFENSASFSPIARVSGTPGKKRAASSAVGMFMPLVSLPALKTWKPRPSVREAEVDDLAEVAGVDVAEGVAAAHLGVGEIVREELGVLVRLDDVADAERVDVEAGAALEAAGGDLVQHLGEAVAVHRVDVVVLLERQRPRVGLAVGEADAVGGLRRGDRRSCGCRASPRPR